MQGINNKSVNILGSTILMVSIDNEEQFSKRNKAKEKCYKILPQKPQRNINSGRQ